MNSKIIMAVAALVGALSMGCSSGSPCDGSSKCSADTKPTDAQRQQCKDDLNALTKCKTETTNLQQCILDNQVCGTDNKTDGTATLAKCTSQASALETCESGAAGGDAGT